MEEDRSLSLINLAVVAANNSQPPNLIPEPSTTNKEIRSERQSTAENANIENIDVHACTEEVDDEPQEKRQKRTTSMVWSHFTKVHQTSEENGKKTVTLWAHCNKCKYMFSCIIHFTDLFDLI
ncbi:hypothetical protein OROGR_020659 [Orobanche gracilis]